MANKQTEYEKKLEDIIRNSPQYNLSDLLKGNPPGSFDLTEEDHVWLNMKPVGNEFGA